MVADALVLKTIVLTDTSARTCAGEIGGISIRSSGQEIEAMAQKSKAVWPAQEGKKWLAEV